MQLLEDYEHNTEKMKYYFDKGMDDMRSQTLIQVQQIQAKYGVNTTEMTDALKSLYLDVDRMKIDHLNQTMSLQQSYNKMYSDEIDRMYDYQTEARQNYADLASNGQQ
jgi:DNA repair ATPase RecN